MAILVDLDSDEENNFPDPREQLRESLSIRQAQPWNESNVDEGREEQTENREAPNLGLFSAALGCYPVVSQLALHLDLNTLHALSRTCRQFRANLLPYRAQLVARSLRCVNDDVGVGERLAEGLRAASSALRKGVWAGGDGWRREGAIAESSPESSNSPRFTSGRVGRCARDLVQECRRCGINVCRNCVVKSPASKALSGRHRRLCRVCLSKPLSWHCRPNQTLTPHYQPSDTSPEARSDADSYFESTPSLSENVDKDATSKATVFTSIAFTRTPCTCATRGVWICQPCARTSSLTYADTTYFRGWQWRTRYASRLSGNGNGSLGNGLGEGVEGVECGRRAGCAAAKQVEVEEEVPVKAGEDSASSIATPTMSGSSTMSGYYAQEIESIGGAIHQKIRRLVLVGAAVGDVHDEAYLPLAPTESSMSLSSAEVDRTQPLWEERTGRARSWCAWCFRVIPSGADEKTMGTPT